MFVAITDNGGGPRNIYHDIAGEVYTFPSSSRNLLLPGTKVVYHRAAQRRKEDFIPESMSVESHYFGTAEIGEVTLTPEGNYRATILNYEPFKYPVYIHRPDGEYYEKSGNFRRGVRKIDKETYDDIRRASLVPSELPSVKKGKTRSVNKGIRSFEELKQYVSSGSFLINGKSYKVVTGSNGFYLESPDNIYYELRKMEDFEIGRWREINIFSSSKTGNILVRHDGKEIFILSPIVNGVRVLHIPTNEIINVHM